MATSNSQNNPVSQGSFCETPTENGKRIYFACPMFSAMEKEYGLKLAGVLAAHGYKVFVPFRDGYEAAQLEGKTEEELVAMIFAKDLEEVKKGYKQASEDYDKHIRHLAAEVLRK